MEFDSNSHENAIQEAQRILKEAQTDLALRLEKAVEGVREVAQETMHTIGQGGQRALWRTSYFFDSYEDVYQRINREDARVFLAAWSVARGGLFENNVIKKIVDIYIDKLLEPHERDQAFLNELYEKLVRSSTIMMHLVAKFKTSGLAKNAVVSAITEAIYVAVIKKAFIREGFKKFGMSITLAFQFYGYFDKAAVSASKLKRECPVLYWSFYANEIEMLYFIFEPLFKHGISTIKKGKGSNVDDVYLAIMEIVGYN
ncbi:hypothetical protein XBJ2_60020 [Xenorhabdus bovienii str. Jollieti]|uniref:Uncharacterized protein n=1 Tax=Xenorhabdus bovienii (strain SS-2004) TaxID=406818 RepID=D3UYE3_XENBS|nr:hypothetical protein [Xenorhabdus bovienii]CBJ79321.1 hypothetical protein XBJ1_0170 [Xenorhabdus bovienii SS-2004]CDH30164.1 hypothetical protein XBJ2_60020 [Xenorhabdus bovienii str. Jollieti]